MGKWNLKLGHELEKYLGLDKTEQEPAPGGGKQDNAPLRAGPFGLKPPEGLLKYLETCSNKPETKGKRQPAKPKTEFDAKDYLSAFSKWDEKKTELWGRELKKVGKAYDMTKEYSPLPKTEMQIQALLDLIPEGSAHDAGVFISYVVNEVYPRDAIELRTNNKPIGMLGTSNAKKEWTIIGDVGDFTGVFMTGGDIFVKGNSGSDVGRCMKGGRIVVAGDVYLSAGREMTDGVLYVKGNANWHLGMEMKGGKIFVEGNVGDNAGDGASGGRSGDSEIYVKGHIGKHSPEAGYLFRLWPSGVWWKNDGKRNFSSKDIEDLINKS